MKILKPKEDESYKNYIDRVLQSRENIRNKDSPMEQHHIIPRCMNGSDEEDNLIFLYPEEHYWAHELLFKENPNNKHLATAWWFISRKNGKDITADDYGQLRQKYINSIQGSGNPGYGKKRERYGRMRTVVRVMDGKEWDMVKQCAQDEHINIKILRKMCQQKEMYMYEEDYCNFQERLEKLLATPYGECFK